MEEVSVLIGRSQSGDKEAREARRVHFTPVWYPDGYYPVYTYVMDMWTPSGMLSTGVTDSVYIQGSMYDDWYSKRE